MKRMIALLLAFCLLAAALAACAAPENPTEAPSPTAPQPPSSQEPSSEEHPESEPTEETEESSTPAAEPYALTASYANAYRNSLGQIWVQVLIAVENTSDVPLCLDYSDVTVHVSDSEAQTLSYVMAFPNVIAPGETGYYYEEAELNHEADGALELTPELVISEATTLPERFTVRDVTLSDSLYGGLQMHGTVEDPNAQEGKLIFIAATLFDAADKPLAVCYTIHTETEATTAEFELISFMLPERITANTVARFEVCAYPYSLEAMQ